MFFGWCGVSHTSDFLFPSHTFLLPTWVLPALAAGNTVVLQPSTVGTGASAALLSVLVPKYLDRALVSLVGTGFARHKQPACTGYLLEPELLGKIIFTDRTHTQTRQLHGLAARHLVPCVYEVYSHHNPVYIDNSVEDLDMAAKRVVWSCMCNAGQNRYAPKYVLCHQDVVTHFIGLCQQWCEYMYGHDPEQSAQFGRIVNQRNLQALATVVKCTQEYALAYGQDPSEEEESAYDRANVRSDWSYGFCNIVCGGTYNALGLSPQSTLEHRYYAPTVLHVSRDVPILDEDFDIEDAMGGSSAGTSVGVCGPILSIVAVKDVHDAIAEMNGKRKRPLAMYIFSDNVEKTRTVVAQTSAGGVTINSCLWHTKHPELASSSNGQAPWRGRASMETFSNMKAIMEKTSPRGCGPCSDSFWVYPPFSQFAALKLFVMNCCVRW
jgi:acyl-CoA reductase-like NAD-dependent aldehyde dehydrogenase